MGRNSKAIKNSRRYGYRSGYPSQPSQKRHFKRNFILLVILVLLVGWLYLFNLLRPFNPLIDTVEVGQVTVTKTRVPDQLKVQLTRFDTSDNQKSSPPFYLIKGSQLELKYEYVVLPGWLSWLGFAGLHSGYILTGLQGYNPDNTASTPQFLGAPNQTQSPLVSPQFGSLSLKLDGQPHVLLMTSTGLQEI